MKYILVFLIFLGLACSPQVEKRYLNDTDILTQLVPANTPGGGLLNPCCREFESYTPDTNYLDHTPFKYVRVNLHFMNSEDSTQNFNGREGIKFGEDLIHAANYDIRTNDKLFLPYGNDLPNLPPRYRLVLTPNQEDDPEDKGIYFHYDDELYYYIVMGRNRNRHRREVVDKYATNTDSVLNIFIMPHHPDSVASPTYDAYRCGISLGNAVKIAGAYENSKDPWMIRQVVNHEVGHVYGLVHTWAYNDGCDDTPNNPRCWNRTKNPPCDTAASNNLMDYNAYQNAWSPCQIGKMQFYMANPKNNSRKYLISNWCSLQEDQHIFIRDSIHWKGMKDLEGHLTIESGGSLEISCRVSLPKDAKITVEPGGKLILNNCTLHNACGDEWDGIEIQTSKGVSGKVVFVGTPKLENMRHGI